MGLSSAHNSAVSGLQAATLRAQVVSSNLANIETEGYGLRQADLQPQSAGSGGVRVTGILRQVNDPLLADRRQAEAAKTASARLAEGLQRLDRHTAGADGTENLPARLSDFDSALISASSEPSSSLRLATAVQKLQKLVGALNSQAAAVVAERGAADAQVAKDVNHLNSHLQRAHEINQQLLRSPANTAARASLLDARQTTIDEISRVLPVRIDPQPNGTVHLQTGDGLTLLGSRPSKLGFVQTSVPTLGKMGAVTIEVGGKTQSLTPRNLGNGGLAASLQIRDDLLPARAAALDALAFDLAGRVNEASGDSPAVAEAAGILTDGAARITQPSQGLAARLSVNAALTRDGGAYLLRDGLASGDSDGQQDATRLKQLHAALGPSNGRAMITQLAEFAAATGEQSVNAEADVAFATAHWTALKAQELSEGVNTDNELQSLLQIEKAYGANAKVLSVVDRMLQTILEV